MENYIETLEQVIILLEDNRKIICHGDNIECNQILIDKLHDVYKFNDRFVVFDISPDVMERTSMTLMLFNFAKRELYYLLGKIKLKFIVHM